MRNYYKGKRILVTGGLGFVGRHLVNKLASSGGVVFITDKVNHFEGKLGVTFFQLDVSNYEDVKYVIDQVRPNIIFHLAAIVTAVRDFILIDKMIEINLKGTTNLLRAIDGLDCLECVINFGTCEEYGNLNFQLNENIREEPASPYAILKLTTTRFCNMFSEFYKIPIITIRPANLYGPGQIKEKFIPYVILKCLQNTTIDMTLGEQKRNFIYIHDFINAVLLIAQKERNLAQIYNIGSENNVTLRYIVDLIKRNIGSDSIINFGAINYRENEMMNFDINIDKMKKLGWVPQFNLSEGLSETIKYYQSLGDDVL